MEIWSNQFGNDHVRLRKSIYMKCKRDWKIRFIFSKDYLCWNAIIDMEKNDDNRSVSGRTVTKQKPASIRRLLEKFCGYTTAHGLGRLSESKNIISRLAWSLFCIGALTMFVLQVYNLFLIYLSRPVSTVVKVEHDSVSMVSQLLISLATYACSSSMP